MGESVDPTGLTFTVTYSDGTEPALVSPQAHTPTTWGETAGTQTCTFTYTEDGETVSCAVEATVAERPAAVTVVGLSISGVTQGDIADQQVSGEVVYPDDMVFTYTLSNGDTIVRNGGAGVFDSVTQKALADETGLHLTDQRWTQVDSTETVTVTVYSDSDEWSYWASLGYEVADPAPSVQITFAPAFQVNGTVPTGYVNRDVDTTGLSYTYLGQSVDPSDVTVSPTTWEFPGTGETVTFTYDGNTATKTADVLRTVANLPVVQTVTYDTTVPVTEEKTYFRNCLPSVNYTADPDHQGQYITFVKFVLDLNDPQFTPISMQEGDIVWWYQTKSDYTNDQANGCNASDMMALLGGYGILDSGSNPGLLFDIYRHVEFPAPSYLPTTEGITDFEFEITLNGTPQAQSNTEVCFVVGQAKGSVADASTLKPSDVDLLAVWDVTFTV